jgi:Proteasome maturation factor UMP1
MIIRKEQDKMKMLSVVYGSHLPFQLLMERNILSQKPKGIQNINLGLDISLGRDQKLPFPCYIDNRPRFELEINSIKYS